MKKVSKIAINSEELVKLIIDAAEEKLAENITVVQMNSANGISDFFVICQGDTTVHNQAICSGVVDSLTEKGCKPWHVEGTDEGRWILADFSDVVLHVMLPELRDYYRLEELGTVVNM
ncbi:MAG: ribosome silencing factor [Chitinispirillaceae bacterium]|nr:ribosome silencing factor [Chitinispirillaceae bacterium]